MQSLLGKNTFQSVPTISSLNILRVSDIQLNNAEINTLKWKLHVQLASKIGDDLTKIPAILILKMLDQSSAINSHQFIRRVAQKMKIAINNTCKLLATVLTFRKVTLLLQEQLPLTPPFHFRLQVRYPA